MPPRFLDLADLVCRHSEPTRYDLLYAALLRLRETPRFLEIASDPLVRRLEERSEGLLELGEGTIYASLHRLERDRLVSSSWTQHAGRRRRVYELTTAGAEALQRRTTDWQRFARGMSTVLGGGTA